MSKHDTLKTSLLNRLDTDNDKIEIVAFLLNEVEPNKDNLANLINQLEDGIKCELYGRLAHHYDEEEKETENFGSVEDEDIDEAGEG